VKASYVSLPVPGKTVLDCCNERESRKDKKEDTNYEDIGWGLHSVGFVAMFQGRSDRNCLWVLLCVLQIKDLKNTCIRSTDGENISVI
jgi:hypothetical protein